MSHSITVTRTTTATTATAIVLNTGILRTPSGLLKVFETIIGVICLGLMSNYYYSESRGTPEYTLFFIVTFAFLVTTFLLLVSFLVSLMAASTIPKTIFEFLYHLFAFIFYISASLAMLVYLSKYKHRVRYYEGKMAATILGLINSALYLFSTFFSFKSYRPPA